MRLEAVTLDAVGTLIAVAEPIGRTYARFATRHGIALAPDEAERGFGEALADAPPLAFPGVDAARLAERERAWWSAVVRRAFGPAAERPSFDRCFAELFAHYGRPEAIGPVGDRVGRNREVQLLGLIGSPLAHPARLPVRECREQRRGVA